MVDVHTHAQNSRRDTPQEKHAGRDVPHESPGLIRETWNSGAAIVKDAWKAFGPSSEASASLPSLTIDGDNVPQQRSPAYSGRDFMRDHPHVVNAAIGTVDGLAATAAAAATIETGPGAVLAGAAAGAAADTAMRKALGLTVSAQTVAEGAVMGAAAPLVGPALRIAGSYAKPLINVTEAAIERTAPQLSGSVSGAIGFVLPIPREAGSAAARGILQRTSLSVAEGQVQSMTPHIVPNLQPDQSAGK